MSPAAATSRKQSRFAGFLMPLSLSPSLSPSSFQPEKLHPMPLEYAKSWRDARDKRWRFHQPEESVSLNLSHCP